jgi:hypothetical protein
VNELDELRLRIAKLKGWSGIRYDNIRRKCVGEPPEEPGIFRLNYSVPDWTGDIAESYQLESEISETERGVYLMALYQIVKPDPTGVNFDSQEDVDRANNDYMWSLVHATPEQRCRAWLAWKESKK